MPQDNKKKKAQATALINKSRAKKTAAKSQEKLADGQRKLQGSGKYLGPKNKTPDDWGKAADDKAKRLRKEAAVDSVRAERIYPGIGSKKKSK